MKVIDAINIHKIGESYMGYDNTIMLKGSDKRSVYVCWNNDEVITTAAPKPKLRKQVDESDYIQIDRQEIREKVNECYRHARKISGTEGNANVFELEYIMNATLDLVQMAIAEQLRHAFDCGKYTLGDDK